MTNLIIAYILIAVILTGYGVTLYRRTRAVDRGIRELEEQSKER
jgi:hypothetical protein